jgi:hypothetical protein
MIRDAPQPKGHRDAGMRCGEMQPSLFTGPKGKPAFGRFILGKDFPFIGEKVNRLTI